MRILREQSRKSAGIGNRDENQPAYGATQMRIVVNSTGILTGRPVRVGNIANGEEQCRNRNRDRQDHKRRVGKIDNVGKQYGRYCAGSAQRGVARVIAVLVPGAGMANDETEKVQCQERRCADKSLHWKRKEIERKHIEQQVPDVRVDEATQDHRVVLPVAHKVVRPEQTNVDDTRHPEKPQQTDTNGDCHNQWCSDLSVLKHQCPAFRSML